MRFRIAACLLGLGFALGCAPDVEPDGPGVDTSAATIAVFRPNAAAPCLSRMPYPVDLVKNPTTGKLAIPYCEGDSEAQIGIKTGLRTLDGWAVTTAIYTDFQGALDPATLAGALYLLDLTHGGMVEFHSVFDTAAGRLYMLPTAPLLEKTRYAVIVTNHMLDADGEAPVADQIFTLLKSETPLIDELGYSRSAALSDADANGLEPLRLLYDQLFKFVIEAAPLELTRAETIVAWTFTTQTVEGQLTSLAGEVADPALGDVTVDSVTPAATHPLLAAAGIPTDHLCRVYNGRVSLRNLLDASGMLGPDFTTTVVDEPVDYLLLTPKGASTTCANLTVADPWDFTKVAVFVHGLGRCKNDALALADTLANATIGLGYATLSIDGVRAGARVVSALGDQDMDGCPDQGATPELIALAGESPNPFGVRDRLWQWGMEVMQLAKVANASPWDFTGAAAPATLPATKVALIGHSWGGMAAVLGGAVSPDVDLLAVNATSADLTTMFTPLLAAGLAEQLTAAGLDIGVDPGKAQYEAMLNETVAAFGWALEPADPRFAANLYGDLPVLVQVMTSGNQLEQADAPLHAATTQEALVTALDAGPLASVTFELACVDGTEKRPICDDATGVVGAMLQPCVESSASPYYPAALAKLTAARTQLVTFLATNGASIGAGDAPVTCP